MATQQSQRIGIWVIAIVMMIGTIAGFAAMILGPKNQASEQSRYQQLMADYQKQVQAYQAKVNAQGDELSKQYYDSFKPYESQPAAFDAASVTELKKDDLKVGDGEAITKNSEFSAYYIGWNPSGKVFDSSFNGSALKAPLDVKPGGVISGWTEGVDGMKVGGVRELTIPADKAYGSTGQGADIPANTPLKFIIMVIPKPAAIEQPQPSEELKNLYAQQQQQ